MEYCELVRQLRAFLGLAPSEPASTGSWTLRLDTVEVAFQIARVDAHLAELPTLTQTGMPEAPRRLSMKLAADVSDHVIFLHKGKIEEEGAPADLFGNPKTERLRGFLSALSAFLALTEKSLDGGLGLVLLPGGSVSGLGGSVARGRGDRRRG